MKKGDYDKLVADKTEALEKARKEVAEIAEEWNLLKIAGDPKSLDALLKMAKEIDADKPDKE